MPKLKKEDFDRKFRFREARINNPRDGLVNKVNCASCTNKNGGSNDHERDTTYCCHPERFRRIKIAQYWSGISGGHSHNIASEMVCDAFTSNPLPEGVVLPVIPENHAILLGSQYADPYHADANCSYVVEEARMIATTGTGILKGAEIRFIDLSDKVPGETIRDKCEMPCCEAKLPYQLLYNPNGYRARVRLKPDGSEPVIWVRNGIVKHERKKEMTPEETEAVFDLTRFNTLEVGFGRIQDRIIAVSNHLSEHCNRLGSRPLSESVNPVFLDSHYHVLKDSLGKANADAWVYDERLFDEKKGLEKPLEDLERIPEGVVPCMDTQRVFRNTRYYCRDLFGTYYFYGIVKPSPENLTSRGASHFVDIGAVSFHDTQHMWGEFGKGFNGLASFHEE